MKDSITINKSKIYYGVSILVLIIIWKVVSVIVGKPIIIPSPEETTSELLRIIASKEFFPTVSSTISRVFIGYLITMGASLLLGVISGFNRVFYYLLKPLVMVFKSIPTMAVILLAIIWLKSELAPILVVFLVIFPMLYESTVHGIRNVDEKLIEMAKVYEIKGFSLLWNIYMPSIRSIISSSLSSTIGLSLKVVIASEVLSQPKISIGTNFQMEKAYLNTSGVFAWAVIAVAIVTVFEIFLKYSCKKLNKTKI